MATTKTKKANATIIETATGKVLGLVTKVNDFALIKTEKAVVSSFAMAEKCIGFSGKLMKKGLQVSASQQDMVFDVLGNIKKKVVKK
jgi:hypothetical protein